MSVRAGFTLMESLVALALAGLVSCAVAGVLTAQARVVRALTDQAADADAQRVTAAVLRAELRLLVPEVDVRSVMGDSIAVRLHRGTGIVCAVAGDRLLLQYSGDRLPAPAKDSGLVRTAAGETAHAIVAAEPSSCAGMPALALRLAGLPPAAAVAVLIFESGTYFLRDRALRYRLGAAGRQPITDERFASSGSAVRVDSGRAVVPIVWPGESRRSMDTLRIQFFNTVR